MTQTLSMTPKQIAALKRALEARGFQFRPLPYGHYQARGDDVVVNAYDSGKVVVQGKGLEEFLAREGLKRPERPRLSGRCVGSDESGKGDYFGPLVVAAVVVVPDQQETLERAGVRDSKKMGEAAVHRAAAVIRKTCPHAVRLLSPEEYNARHEAEKNVALFLSTLHAEAIREALGAERGGVRVVIDQFTFADRLEGALKREGIEAEVEIRPRAEDNVAVAAASVLARAEFLIALRELGDAHGVELPKGAGPQVERRAREIAESGGLAELAQVAKIHFKTTKKATERLF